MYTYYILSVIALVSVEYTPCILKDITDTKHENIIN